MWSKAKQVLIEEARKLKSKAFRKSKESEVLYSQAEELLKKAEEIE